VLTKTDNKKTGLCPALWLGWETLDLGERALRRWAWVLVRCPQAPGLSLAPPLSLEQVPDLGRLEHARAAGWGLVFLSPNNDDHAPFGWALHPCQFTRWLHRCCYGKLLTGGGLLNEPQPQALAGGWLRPWPLPPLAM